MAGKPKFVNRRPLRRRIAEAVAPFFVPFLRGLFRLFRIRRRTVLFVSFPDGADNAFAMFEYLRTAEPGLDLVWLVSEQSAALRERLSGARLVRQGSLQSFRELSTAGCIFHTHGLSRAVGERSGQVVFNLWHGMPLKTIGTYDPHDKRLPLTSFTIATSPLFRRVMAQAMAVPEERVLLAGQPRNDRMLRKSEADRPSNALWMPTYRHSIQGKIRTDSSLTLAEQERLIRDLDSVLASMGGRVLLKLHPMDALNRHLKDAFQAIAIVGRDHPDEPVEDLLAHARCLVTDYSSAAIDFAVLDRPIGYYCPDRDDYSRGFIDEVLPAFYGAGVELKDTATVARFLVDPWRDSGTDTSMLVSTRTPTACETIWHEYRKGLN